MVEPKRRLVLPPVDFYKNGSMLYMIENFDYAQRIFSEFILKVNERHEKLNERVKKLKDRGLDINDQIGSIINSSKAEKILTPSKFPTSYNFDFRKIAREMLKTSSDLPGDKIKEIVDKSLRESFTLHRKDHKGEEPRVRTHEYKKAMNLLFRESKIPNIFPTNKIRLSGHLDNLHERRGEVSKKRLKNIDGVMMFNTRENIFGDVEVKVAENKERRRKRRRRKNNDKDNNPIGIDLANTSTLDNTMTNSLVPNINADSIKFKPEAREAAKIQMEGTLGLTGVVDFQFEGDDNFMGGMMNDDMFGDSSGLGGFGDDGGFGLGSDDLMGQESFGGSTTAPQSEVTIATTTPSTDTSVIEAPSVNSVPPPPPVGGIPPPPPNVTPGEIPPPPPGGIPPPPPISILANPIPEKPAGEGDNGDDAPPPVPEPPKKAPITNQRMGFLEEIKAGNFKLKRTETRFNMPPPEAEVSKEDYLRQKVLERYDMIHQKPVLMRKKKRAKRANSDSESETSSDDESESGSDSF